MLCTWCGEYYEEEEMKIVEKVGLLCLVCVANLDKIAGGDDDVV